MQTARTGLRHIGDAQPALVGVARSRHAIAAVEQLHARIAALGDFAQIGDALAGEIDSDDLIADRGRNAIGAG